MRKVSLFTTNNNIATKLSEQKLDVELNGNSRSGDVCIIDCSAYSDYASYIFRPCIAIVDKSNYRVPFESDYIIQQPFDVNCIMRAINLLLGSNDADIADNELASDICSLFEQIGMDPKRLGFGYALESVLLFLKSNGKYKYRDIFAQIASDNATTLGAVERAIRTAIERAWQYGDIKKIYALFGNSINPDKGKPSNAEFIAGIAQQFLPLNNQNFINI